MSKAALTKDKVSYRPQCQHRSQCDKDAVWGVYTWRPGDTTVDTSKAPIRVYCGEHKPKHHHRHSRQRNVRLR